MATILLAEVILPYTTGLPRDVSINSMHFTVGSGVPIGDTVFDDLTQAIHDFWNVPADAPGHSWDGTKLSLILSTIVSRVTNACRVKFYDAQAAVGHQVLLGERQWTMSAGDSGDPILPNEIAICNSLTCTPGGSVPIRRRRGRMYLGPLSTAVVGSMTVGGLPDYPAVSSDIRGLIADKSQRLAEDLTAPYTWSVYSKTNDEAYAVSGGFIDNDFDTQRRRQVDSTSRTTWGLAP